MEICTSHFKEDLDWLLDSPWPVTVVDHEGADPHNLKNVFTVPNVGNEATSYLKFIIERYDTLPEYTAFIHGHEHSFHQQGGKPLLELIRTANTQKYDYIPLNNAWRFLIRSTMLKEHEDFYKKVGLDPLDVSVMEPYAQFIVSKNLIKRHPRRYYEFLFDNVHSKSDAVKLEYAWHLIFGKMSLWPLKKDLFDPPVEKLNYFTGIPFPVSNKLPLVVLINSRQYTTNSFPNISTREEYEKYRKESAWFIKCGHVDFDAEVQFECSSLESLLHTIIFIYKLNEEYVQKLDAHI